MSSTLHFGGNPPGLAAWRAVWEGPVDPKIAPAARAQAEASAAAVAAIVTRGAPAYGINTGFGKLASQRIDDDHLAELQANLLRSHAVGLGPALPDPVVRLILALKLGSLLRGLSGVRGVVLDTLAALLRADVLPVIPSQGSVGASGDLAPLSHLSLVLIGEGRARVHGVEMSAAEALTQAGVAPIVLGPKEGLALINGTQVSTALALQGLFYAERVFAAAIVAGALTVDAARGSDAPFDPRIHEARGHLGQIEVAEHLRFLLVGSEIRASHLKGDERVQDPYSLRCQPQVMGAVLDHLRHVARILRIEAHAVSDNPLLFPGHDGWDVLSGGNFHAEPVALVADQLAVALAEIGAISERRVALLIDSSISRLPAFLVRDPGLNSGFMIAHVTAAALASENKSLAHPASVDSLPTSANQEDHVSMATFGARRTTDIARNVAGIVGIELLAAAQGVDLLRPLRSSDALETEHARLRAIAAPYDHDRYLAPDLQAAQALVLDGAFVAAASDLLPSYCGGDA